jgi:hypothetical protein
MHVIPEIVRGYYVQPRDKDDKIPSIFHNLFLATSVYPNKPVPYQIVENFLRDFADHYKPITTKIVDHKTTKSPKYKEMADRLLLASEDIEHCRKLLNTKDSTIESLQEIRAINLGIIDSYKGDVSNLELVNEKLKKEVERLRIENWKLEQDLLEFKGSDVAKLRQKIKDAQNPEYVQKVRLAKKILRAAQKHIEL